MRLCYLRDYKVFQFKKEKLEAVNLAGGIQGRGALVPTPSWIGSFSFLAETFCWWLYCMFKSFGNKTSIILLSWDKYSLRGRRERRRFMLLLPKQQSYSWEVAHMDYMPLLNEDANSKDRHWSAWMGTAHYQSSSNCISTAHIIPTFSHKFVGIFHDFPNNGNILLKWYDRNCNKYVMDLW